MAAEILYERGLRLNAVREEVSRQSGNDPRAAQKKETPHLAEFSRDLTEDAANDKLDPLVGREAEIERVVQILCRRTKNNPVLIGEPGVGKTAWPSASSAATCLRSLRTSASSRLICRSSSRARSTAGSSRSA